MMHNQSMNKKSLSPQPQEAETVSIASSSILRRRHLRHRCLCPNLLYLLDLFLTCLLLLRSPPLTGRRSAWWNHCCFRRRPLSSGRSLQFLFGSLPTYLEHLSLHCSPLSFGQPSCHPPSRLAPASPSHLPFPPSSFSVGSQAYFPFQAILFQNLTLVKRFLVWWRWTRRLLLCLTQAAPRLTAPPFPATLHSPLISSSWHLYPLIKCDARRMALLKSGSQKMYSLKMNSGEEREADCDCSSGAVW